MTPARGGPPAPECYIGDRDRQNVQASEHTLGDAHRVGGTGGGGMWRVFVALETASGGRWWRRAFQVAAGVADASAGRSSWQPASSIRTWSLLRRGESDGLPSLRPCISWTASRFGAGCCEGDADCTVAGAAEVLRDVASALAYAHAKRGAPGHRPPTTCCSRAAGRWWRGFGVAERVAAGPGLSGAPARAPAAHLFPWGSRSAPAYVAPEQGAGDLTRPWTTG